MRNARDQKLAIFLPSLSAGGAERVTLNLIEKLTGQFKSIDLVLVHRKTTDSLKAPEGVRLVNLESSRAIASLPALIRYLRTEKPDVLLSALNFANIIALIARRLADVPTRIIVSEHNTLSIANENAQRKRSRLIPLLIKIFYPWADGIVAVSNGVADDLSQMTGLERESIDVIYNPVITEEVQQKAQAEPDHPWFDPGQPPVIIGVGRLRPQKDFPTLIRAFARLRAKQPARLMILGEGSDRPDLEQLIKELGIESDVSLHGFVKNPYAYMRKASVYVLSSRWEGLPTVLIEALYCGVPIVSTDCPSGPQEILANGKYGTLVSVGDVDALSTAIERCLAGKNPIDTNKSWEPYTIDVVVDNYIHMMVGSDA